MNMFARFDENPAMTLRVIKETKRYGRTDPRENSIPPTNKVCRGYNKLAIRLRVFFGPRREKTCLRSFQLGHAQTNLLSYKD